MSSAPIKEVMPVIEVPVLYFNTAPASIPRVEIVELPETALVTSTVPPYMLRVSRVPLVFRLAVPPYVDSMVLPASHAASI